MDRLSFEHCYLINLFNVSVEKFVSNSPSTPGESKRNQIRNKLKNLLISMLLYSQKPRAWAKIYQANG